MRRFLFASCLLLSAILSSHALHFYLDANEKRCFIEELPTDTVVEGLSIMLISTAELCLICCIGHYRALEWSEARQEYVEDPQLGIHVEVDVRTPSSLAACFSLDYHLSTGTRKRGNHSEDKGTQ